MLIALTVIVILAVCISAYAYHNMNYDQGVPRLLEKAGFTEKQVALEDGSVINYGEGPGKGVPLLLIHGQMVSWQDYAKVLSGLSKSYHVYAVDCYGHGGSSKDPVKYTAQSNGADLAWFIENVIKQPAVISGHSSGGLMAAWIAANKPDDVISLVIEDAPFFATEADRRENTYSWVDGFKTIHEYLSRREEGRYINYYLEHCYMQNFWGKDGWEKFVLTPTNKYMTKHPSEKLRLWFLPPSMNKGVFDLTRCIQDGTGEYDLRFGDAFYAGAWFENFDQAETLGRVQCPSVLMHTEVKTDDRGILLGAMSSDDANRAHLLLRDNQLIDHIKSGHDIHDEKPDYFIKVMEDLLNRVNNNGTPHTIKI
ncbi:MAG TPA: alpha/beta hydrolase [Syntrophomonas sp.]|nr:alpha/beta hydrolase [Syntrophomonas sp.]